MLVAPGTHLLVFGGFFGGHALRTMWCGGIKTISGTFQACSLNGVCLPTPDTESYLLARTAKATDATKHTIDDLYETQDELNSTKGQEDGEQRDIPYYYVVGF